MLGDLTFYRALNTTSSSVKKNEPCLTMSTNTSSITRRSDEFISHLSEFKAYLLRGFLNEDLFASGSFFGGRLHPRPTGLFSHKGEHGFPTALDISRDRADRHALSANSENGQKLAANQRECVCHILAVTTSSGAGMTTCPFYHQS